MLVFVQILAPPKVTNVKIIGDLRENSKISVTGTVTGGTEGASRVQWFKSTSEKVVVGNLEAVSTSKVAKVSYAFVLNYSLFTYKLFHSFDGFSLILFHSAKS